MSQKSSRPSTGLTGEQGQGEVAPGPDTLMPSPAHTHLQACQALKTGWKPPEGDLHPSWPLLGRAG